MAMQRENSVRPDRRSNNTNAESKNVENKTPKIAEQKQAGKLKTNNSKDQSSVVLDVCLSVCLNYELCHN